MEVKLPSITIDVELLKKGLHDHFALDNIEAAIAKLKGKFSVGALIAVISEAIIVVEKIVAEAGELAGPAGEAKHQAVSQFVDDVVKLPFWIEPFDGWIIHAAIDGLVTWYNIRFGKQWITKLSALLT